jgi:hypothetical protein
MRRSLRREKIVRKRFGAERFLVEVEHAKVGLRVDGVSKSLITVIKDF